MAAGAGADAEAARAVEARRIRIPRRSALPRSPIPTSGVPLKLPPGLLSPWKPRLAIRPRFRRAIDPKANPVVESGVGAAEAENVARGVVPEARVAPAERLAAMDPEAVPGPLFRSDPSHFLLNQIS